MKKSIYLILILFLSFTTYSSFADGTDEYEDFSKLRELKGRALLVVIDDSTSAYGKAIKESFRARWTATIFRFVTSEEASKYMDSDKYAIFAFVVKSRLYKGVNEAYNNGKGDFHEGGVQILKKTEIVMADNVIPSALTDWKLENNPSGNQVKDAQYYYAFFLCNDSKKASKNNGLIDLKECFTTGVNIETVNTQYKPIKYFQAQLAPSVLSYVVRYNNEVTGAIAGKKDKVKKEMLKMPCYRNGVKAGIDYRAQVYDYNEGLIRLQGKKLYVDSELVNDTTLRFIRKILKVDSTLVSSVNKSKIEKIYQERSPDKVVFDYCRTGPYNNVYFYAIYTSEGDKLIEFFKDLSNVCIGVKSFSMTF